MASAGGALAQDVRTLGLPPPSGSQNPALPPPSGSQYPALPPPSGSRYAPGVGGHWAEPDGARPRLRAALARGQEYEGLVDAMAPAIGPDVADRLMDVPDAIHRCWTPPPRGAAQTERRVTLRFSLRRDGSLIGPPRVTGQSRGGSRLDQAEFTRSAQAAISACSPLRLSPALGQSIAGRPFSITFRDRPTQRKGALDGPRS